MLGISCIVVAVEEKCEYRKVGRVSRVSMHVVCSSEY